MEVGYQKFTLESALMLFRASDPDIVSAVSHFGSNEQAKRNLLFDSLLDQLIRSRIKLLCHKNAVAKVFVTFQSQGLIALDVYPSHIGSSPRRKYGNYMVIESRSI